jgi:putative transposase
MMHTAEQLGQQLNIRQACQQLGVPRSSLYRRRQPPAPSRPRPTPARALSAEERAAVRAVLNSEPFQDKAPRQVYGELLDEQLTYLCHWRTMYRILDSYQEVKERRNQLQHPKHAKPELVATGPNQLWSWDITKFKGPSKWLNFYLYVILDVFSRFVVGWLLAEQESEILAQQLISDSCRKQAIERAHLTIHSDRGGPMRAKTVGQLMDDLGVTKSHSRPRTPTDNPYSEAQFKTMKYRPDYPDRFASMETGQNWARPFFNWYNFEHRHSGLALLTPVVVHYGQAEQVLAHRQQVLLAAYIQHPERFVRGAPTPPQLPAEVWINKPPTGPED